MNIFIHIPKTAGNSVRESLSNRKISYHDIGHSNLSNQSIDYKDNFSFCFVRNPYSRLRSAFYHLVDIDVEKARKSDNKFLQRRLSMRNKYGTDFQAFVLDHGFEKFDFSHFYPQTKWIYQGGKRVVNFVGYLEDIDKDFDALCSILSGEGAEISRENVTKTPKYKSKENVGNDVYKVVRDYYRNDFLKLGYSFDVSDTRPRKKLGIIYAHAEVGSEKKERIIKNSGALENGSSYLYVPRCYEREDKDLLIILSTHNQKNTYFAFEKALHSQDTDLLFLTDVDNGYYLSENDRGNVYVDFISRFLKEKSYESVTIFGSSMAGFGALNIGSILDLNIFVTNPQVDLALTESVAWPELKKTISNLRCSPNIVDRIGRGDGYVYCVYGKAPIDVKNIEILENNCLDSSNIILRRINDPMHSFPFPDNIDILNSVHKHLKFLRRSRL